MTLDEAVAAFKRELPGWFWSVSECSVSVHGCCGADWGSHSYQDGDLDLEPIDIELDKPSSPYRGGDRPDPTPADLIMALIEAARAARANRKIAIEAVIEAIPD
jgi:hypothetical protein